MNCDDKTCPWWSDKFSLGHCSHPCPDTCNNIVLIRILRPTLNRLMDSHHKHCEYVYYTSEEKTSLDVNDTNLAIKILLDEISIFNAWMRGELR